MVDEVHGDLASNRRIWNEQFRRITPGPLAERVRDPRAWLASEDRATSFRALMPPDVVDRLDGSRVLELGAGASGLSLVMAQLGASVVALDIAEESARLNAEAASLLGITDRLRPVAGDLVAVLAATPPGSFDVIVCQAFWHHLTHELEEQYLPMVARVLATDGEVRSFEPAVNSRLLDRLRWTIPVKGRPSMLQRERFRAWLEQDAHPERDNSARHFRRVGERHFRTVEITSYGGIERLHRFAARGVSRRPGLRRALVAVDAMVPSRLQDVIARSQLIVHRDPIGTSGAAERASTPS